MKKLLLLLAFLCAATLMFSPAVQATNGVNLIGIGPIARSMGGVGIAYPLDAISAVFANPAAMCFGPYCPSTEVNFAGTLFMPHVKAEVHTEEGTVKADSDEKVYAIPAFGLSVPITNAPPFWRFGLAAYGVSGLGVDYRDTDIDRATLPTPFGDFPLVAGEYTQLMIMKFAPAIAVQPYERLSFGLAAHIDYASLDLRNGSSSNYGAGAQIGMIYKATDCFSMGLNYITPQTVEYKNVLFDGSTGSSADLDLESPQEVGIGFAYQLLDHKLLLETDVKWVNWANASGYDTFDWDNQWVVGVGAQYKPMPKLALRAGYNYASNPVATHNGFEGTLGNFTNVQGTRIPTYYYESFRIIGFPAIVQHHICLGGGYELTPKFALNAGYTHAFQNTIREKGRDLNGDPMEFESSLSEDSLELGFTWRF